MKRELTLEEIQNYLFDMLIYIRDVCEQNGLRYYLAYGTLIGAVRHQGFIPWDDDADIQMPREDYDAFVKIVENDPHPYYRLVSRETSHRYNRLWPRVFDYRTKIYQQSVWYQGVPYGLFVDIFILDGAGNSQEEATSTYQKAYDIYLHYCRAVTRMFPPGIRWYRALKSWVRNLPEKLLGFRFWTKRHIHFCAQKSFDDYIYVSALGAGTKEPYRNIWKHEWFSDGTSVTFNGEAFRAPVDWDSVLRPEYGNYMMPPPLKDQHPKHRYKAILLN